MEVSRELGSPYDFLVEHRRESVNTPAVFRVRENGDKDKSYTNEVSPIEGNEVRRDEP